jgi:hypothetical protein
MNLRRRLLGVLYRCENWAFLDCWIGCSSFAGIVSNLTGGLVGPGLLLVKIWEFLQTRLRS